MKFATYWWGVQILAENAGDKAVLDELMRRLPEKAEHAYEIDGGTVSISTEGNEMGFSDEEVTASPLVIEFNR